MKRIFTWINEHPYLAVFFTLGAIALTAIIIRAFSNDDEEKIEPTNPEPDFNTNRQRIGWTLSYRNTPSTANTGSVSMGNGDVGMSGARVSSVKS